MSSRPAPQRRSTYSGRRRGGSIRTFLILVALVLLAAVILWFFYGRTPGVETVKNMRLELGDPLPEAAAFLQPGYEGGVRIVNAEEIDIRKLGVYTVKLKLDSGRTVSTALTVADTVPPAGTGIPQSGPAGTAVEAGQFVTDIADQTQVTIAFVKTPDFSLIGQQTVQLLLTDEGGNTATVTATLTLYDPNIPPDADPPEGTPVDCDGPVGTVFAPEDFVTDIQDESEVAAAFRETPDFGRNGVQTVVILLTDAFGNQTELSAQLDLWKTSRRPVISGARDLTVEIGEKITYRTGVSATDDVDGEVELSIDSSAVDTYTAGSYPVTYSATDSHGNAAAVTVTVTVTPFDESLVYELAQKKLDTFIKEDMTDMEKVKAVYTWTMSNIGYVNHGDKYDFHKIAYQGIKTQQGDCYTYCVVAEVFFDLLEIEYVQVTRVGGTSQHFWSLVNLGDGWYHFDATPHVKRYNTCMITESRAQEIAADRGNNYYTYEETLYPEVVP